MTSLCAMIHGSHRSRVATFRPKFPGPIESKCVEAGWNLAPVRVPLISIYQSQNLIKESVSRKLEVQRKNSWSKHRGELSGDSAWSHARASMFMERHKGWDKINGWRSVGGDLNMNNCGPILFFWVEAERLFRRGPDWNFLKKPLMRGSATEDHCRKGSQRDILLFARRPQDGEMTDSWWSRLVTSCYPWAD